MCAFLMIPTVVLNHDVGIISLRFRLGDMAGKSCQYSRETIYMGLRYISVGQPIGYPFLDFILRPAKRRTDTRRLWEVAPWVGKELINP